MTKRKKLTFLAVCLAVLCVCVCGLFFRPVKANAELSDVSYQQIYSFNSTLQVQDATLSYGGTDYPATAVVRFPSGKTLSADSVVLDEAGVYFIEYKADANGTLLKESISFTVRDELFSIDGNGGTISYGTNDYLGAGIEGVNVSLNTRSVLKYNKVIDVSDNSLASEKVIKFYCTPATVGEIEAEKIIITLTDAEDPTNFVEVVYKKNSSTSSYNYVTAAANGQPQTGLHLQTGQNAAGTRLYYDGSYWNLYQNNAEYGALLKASWDGILPSGVKSFADNSIELNVDNAMRRIYGHRAVNNPSINLIIDLDEPDFFGDNVWNGFESGKVVMTLRAEKYTSASLNLFITEVDGDDLSSTGVDNDIAPTILVDFGEYDENNLPNIVVNRPCEIFPAYAVDDLDGNVKVETYVYYNYNSTARTDVMLKNGVFTPKHEGVYTILYKATDSFGNVRYKTVEMNAITRENVGYSFTGDYDTEAVVGQPVKVADIEFVESTVLTGYTVSTKAVLQNSDLVYQISEKTMSFMPVYPGKYDIVYTYTDYIESFDFSYEVEVEKVDEPLYLGDVAVPKYFIKNCKYYIPDFSAYEYTEGVKNTVAKKYYQFDDGQLTLVSGDYVTITAEDSVKIVYKVSDSDSGKVYEGKVIDTNYGLRGKTDLAKFVHSPENEFDVLHNEDYIRYTTDSVKSVDGKAVLEVINVGYAKVLDFNVNIPEGKDNFQTLTVKLQAQNDRAKFIEICFEKSASGANISVQYNEKEVVGSTESSFGSADSLRFYVSTDYLCFENSQLTIPFEELFSGFGNKFFISIELGGIVGQSALNIIQLMNQPMGMYSDILLDVESEGFQTQRNYEHAEFTTSTIGDQTISLNRDSVLTALSMVATVPENKANFTTLSVKVTADGGAELVITFTKNGAPDNKTLVMVKSGDKEFTGISSATFGGDSRFRFYVSRGAFAVENTKFEDGKNFSIYIDVAPNSTQTDRRMLFEDFVASYNNSNPVYKPVRVSITLGGVTGQSAVVLTELVGTSAALPTVVEKINPVIIHEAIRDDYKYGDVMIVPIMDSYDFVDPSPTLGVQLNDGAETPECLVSKDEVLLDGTQDYHRTYEVVLDKYMNGVFMYYIYDYSKNVDSSTGQPVKDWIPTAIYIEDLTAPSLQVDVVKTSYKVGDTVKIAKATYEDDNSDVEICVTLIDADGFIKIIKDSFKATKKGEYTIIYQVFDEDGNTSFFQYTIKVK